MESILRNCISKIGQPPRQFSFWTRLTYLRVTRPAWLKQDPTDKLSTIFEHLDRVFREGTVVWGHIVQANSLMFQPGNHNCPGEVVYSFDDIQRVEPADLQDIAHELFQLKGTTPDDPELKPIADYLTDEMIRVFGLKVPSVVSPKIDCKISSTFFVRKHLPNQRICKPLLPLLVTKTEPHVAMPLPERYWPEEFLQWWTRPL